MANEPDPDRHHIFEDFGIAQEFYDAMLHDLSIGEDIRAELRGPRQSHGVWLLDKVI
jgi:hypothetical protein